jgi:hypothetical protein
MTADTYGRWLPTGNKDLVDRLDSARPVAGRQEQGRAVAGARGDRSVTDIGSCDIPDPQVIDSIGSAPELNPAVRFTPI